MTRLIASLLSEDEPFRREVGALLRSTSVQVMVADERSGRGAMSDLTIVDGRHDPASALGAVERLRAADPAGAIFFLASDASPDLILRAMRAGANEYFAWPPAPEAVGEALQRTASRRAALPSAQSHATTIVFFGAKGGAGTTTMAVNCAVDLVRTSKRPTVIVDLKAGLGEVTLFLGVRSRYTLLDALDNLHRLDAEFLRELVVKHKSGLEILASSDLFDRPGGGDTAALEEVFRLLGREYEYIVIDAGAQMNVCTVSALYTADTICLVANPDVPSVRNAQRLLDRIGQLGASSERVRVLLNRAAEPYPIPLAQIQNALGHGIYHTFCSDYRTVSAALNSGVPLTLAGNTELASQFESFTRRVLNLGNDAGGEANRRTGPLRLERLASLW